MKKFIILICLVLLAMLTSCEAIVWTGSRFVSTPGLGTILIIVAVVVTFFPVLCVFNLDLPLILKIPLAFFVLGFLALAYLAISYQYWPTFVKLLAIIAVIVIFSETISVWEQDWCPIPVKILFPIATVVIIIMSMKGVRM